LTFWGTLRSRHEIRIDFDKIYVFYNKYCVRINKFVFIVVKIEYVNFDRINDIYDKVYFITKLHIFYLNKYFIKTHIIFY
jgi:hypothetical protein